MLLSQPIQVFFTPNSPNANRVQVRFGGRVEMAVNAQHSQQVYTIVVQTTEDLRAISDTVGRHAWINVMTPQGPAALALPDFLQQHGLA